MVDDVPPGFDQYRFEIGGLDATPIPDGLLAGVVPLAVELELSSGIADPAQNPFSSDALPTSLDLGQFDAFAPLLVGFDGEFVIVDFQTITITPVDTPIPEPATAWMCLIGLAALGARRRRRPLAR